MKYLILLIGSFIFSISALAQPDELNINFERIDKHSRKIPKSKETSIASITTYLIEPATNDYEKVRAIYTWIVSSITYDNQAYTADFHRVNQSNEDILKRRKAICFGYAKLMEEMCEVAKTPCEVIIGYSKGTPTTFLRNGEIDHAWNAVQLEGEWFLIDATWAAGTKRYPDEFSLRYGTNYFLTTPELFILNHLPVNPIWQLLNCPIKYKTFQQSDNQISKQLQGECSGYHFEDSITNFLQLPWMLQRIKTMELAYSDNPVESNRRELGQRYMDYEGELSTIAESLEGTSYMDSLFDIQSKMIDLCKKANGLTTLFDYQIENCAYTNINQGVAISRKEKLIKADYELMLVYFESAKSLLGTLSETIFTIEGLNRCEVYIEFTKNALESSDW